MNPTIKEYLWSALITFVAAFGAAVFPVASMGAPIDQAALFALIAVGVRAGFAALINLLATNFKTVSSKPQ